MDLEDTLLDIRTDILMLRMVSSSMWANFIANGSDDPGGETRKIAAQMASAVRNSVSEESEGTVNVLHATLDKLESFWQGVEEQARKHPGRAR